MKKGVIFSKGSYPIGSWHQRIRMMKKGFEQNNCEFIYVVPFPAPTIEAKKNSENFVKFMLNPVKKKRQKDFFSIFTKIYGTLKGCFYIMRQKELDFIILPGLDFIEGFFIHQVCYLKKIKLYAEIADENGKLYSEEKLTIVEKMAKYNQIIYEKYLLNKANKIFVVSNYLEKKYSQMYSGKKIYRTIPSMMDLETFKKQQSNNPLEIKQDNIDVLLEKDSIKIIYAGACNRTNGLKFFLESFATIIKQIQKKVNIIFFFVYGNVEEIKQICKELQILEYVTFFKSVYPKYIPAIYKQADILLLPEHGDIIANAGFPGKTSELLASGKAIISTDFSDLSKYLKTGENAMISPIGDKEIYCNNLLKIIEDEDLRKHLGRNAIRTVKEKFDTKEAVKCYLID